MTLLGIMGLDAQEHGNGQDEAGIRLGFFLYDRAELDVQFT